MILFLKIGLGLALIVFSYFLINFILEVRRKRYIDQFIYSINARYENRQREKQRKFVYEGITENKKFIDKIDMLIERSGIRIVFPTLTTEMLIVLAIIVSMIVAYIIQISFDYIFYSITAFVATIFFLIMILGLLARRTYDKIDDQLLVYINTLINLSASSDDIISIMDKSAIYVSSPLREYTEQFVYECNKGVEHEKAFEHFKEKVESRKFKQLLNNLLVCSKHDQNYKEVLNKSRVIMKYYFTEKEKRKHEVRGGRLQILMTLGLGIFLLNMTTSFTDNIFEKLQSTPIGTGIIVYLLFVLLVIIYTFLTLDKVNY